MRVTRQGCLIALINVMLSCSLVAQEQTTQDLWNTGAVGQVIPMDEVAVVEQGVTLISERVWVDLFPGFGVVRSVFRFSNQTDMPIRLKIGYPVRGQFPTAIQALAHFDDARGLKVSIDGQAIITRSEEGRSNGHDPNPFTYQVWDQIFLPDSVTTIMVESVVPTQFSRLASGNQFSTGNAFGISLQGAESWDGLIGHLQVLIRLNGGLMLANIRGLVPDSAFIGNLGHLQIDRTNLEPRPEDNMIVWYSGAAADYPFEKKVTPMLEPLRVSMDTFPVTAFYDPAFQLIRRSDFDLAAGGLTLAGILYFIMFFAPWVILIGFVVFMLLGKRKRRSAQQATDQLNV